MTTKTRKTSSDSPLSQRFHTSQPLPPWELMRVRSQRRVPGPTETQHS
jgi:hypothetical protein